MSASKTVVEYLRVRSKFRELEGEVKQILENRAASKATKLVVKDPETGQVYLLYLETMNVAGTRTFYVETATMLED